LVYNSTNFPNLSIIFPAFLHSASNATQTTTSFNCKPPPMCVHTSYWPYRYAPLMLCPWQQAHETHDVVHDIFVAIVWNVSFHMGQKQLHAFSLTTLNSSHRRVDIVLTKDEICTLVDVLIIDPTHANLLPRSCTTHGLCQCYLEPKRAKGPSLFYLGYFSSSKNFNYIVKDVSILHFKLGSGGRPSYFPTFTFSAHPPITTIDLLQVIGSWDGKFLTFSLC
jgi:hypothetical protein